MSRSIEEIHAPRLPGESYADFMERMGEGAASIPPDAGRLAPKLHLPCFPCLEDPLNKNKDKAPACPNGFKDAQREPDMIRALWRKYPGALVGVPAGVVSGFDVLDVDPKNGGDLFYEANRPRLPDTRIHTTRSGGLHLFFRHLPGLRNSTGKIAPGIDVRADGGYIIWWPLAGFKAIGDLANLPQWPLWLVPCFLPPPPPVRRSPSNGRPPDKAIDGLVRTVATAPQGQRNSVLFWAANRMRERITEGDIGESLGTDLLLDAAVAVGLPHQEAARTIDSAMGGRSA